FFQAEDGIRYFHVTGVQTCALPIFSGRLIGEQDLRTVHQCARDRDALLLTAGELMRHPLLFTGETDQRERFGNSLLHEAARRTRSEERRVGKEGGARSATVVRTDKR